MKRKTPGGNGLKVKNIFLLTEKERRIICSPLRLVIFLGVCIFVSESLIMIGIETFLDSISPVLETVLDATALTLMVSPVLYYLLFKPLMHLVNDSRINEEELQAYRANLELKIRERTGELEIANIALMKKHEEQLRAKEELRESEERFRLIFEQSEDAVVLAAAEDFSIIDVNPIAEKFFGKGRRQLLGREIGCLCHYEGCSFLMSAVEQIVDSGEPVSIETIKCRLDDETLRYHSLQGKLIVLGGVKVIYLVFRDITTKVRLEEESKVIQSRLIQANRMTSLGTMVSSVAHELNNPNNFLLMNARILDSAWGDIMPLLEEVYSGKGDFYIANLSWSEARTLLPEAIDGIQQGAVRISDIIGNLKSLSRDESYNINAQADVNRVVQLAISILGYLINDYTDFFETEFAEGLPKVRGAERQLEQVVINLIQNALQALPDKSRAVKVSTRMDSENGHVLICVADNGRGLPAEIADRVMEPFFTTRLDQGGTGLGLAISSSIVRDSGGFISFVSSEAGHGTTFTVHLAALDSNSADNGICHDNK